MRKFKYAVNGNAYVAGQRFGLNDEIEVDDEQAAALLAAGNWVEVEAQKPESVKGAAGGAPENAPPASLAAPVATANAAGGNRPRA